MLGEGLRARRSPMSALSGWTTSRTGPRRTLSYSSAWLQKSAGPGRSSLRSTPRCVQFVHPSRSRRRFRIGRFGEPAGGRRVASPAVVEIVLRAIATAQTSGFPAETRSIQVVYRAPARRHECRQSVAGDLRVAVAHDPTRTRYTPMRAAGPARTIPRPNGVVHRKSKREPRLRPPLADFHGSRCLVVYPPGQTRKNNYPSACL